MSSNNLVEVAKSLIATSNKNNIIAMARSFGWKGDHARAPILQLALYCAQKIIAGGMLQKVWLRGMDVVLIDHLVLSGEGASSILGDWLS